MHEVRHSSVSLIYVGDEVPGCYGPGQDVVRSSNVPEAITLIGQERAASGNFSARPVRYLRLFEKNLTHFVNTSCKSTVFL